MFETPQKQDFAFIYNRLVKKMNRKEFVMKRVLVLILVVVTLSLILASCGPKKERIVIYTSSDENEIALIRERLDSKFPNYDISIEYFATGDHAAKLKAEGIATGCDISYDLEYGYMEMLSREGIYADISSYDKSIYLDDLAVSQYYIPTMRYGGAIIVSTKILSEKGLPEPSSYEDLLKPEYKNLISMPSPKASGTGYMFYKSLVNAWGEERTIEYFDKLSTNILQFTSSGSGPVNALVQGEVAIALGMTSHAALKITEGHPLKILFFEEGSPYQACGAAIIKGKETSEAVQAVFKYFYEELTSEVCEKLYPEQIYKDKTFTMDNYPTNITYADMKNNTPEEKVRLLDLWTH